ncbi:MAG: dihydroorotate dehydrogenase electron transfer subunit [Candidatus Omnitrophica bacterium]|nr:dihydroorotate dehydrogenase electron transfer subunit [Candidatus Omnitrophota bacterium]
MFQIKAKILYNKRVKSRFYRCSFSAADIAEDASPGQFINIRISNGDTPLLRRPLSIHRIKGSSVEVLYEVIGPGTKILAKKKAGEILDVVGPLGEGFKYNLPGVKRVILAGGGMGVAPLLSLAQDIRCGGKTVLIGARTKKEILCARDFKELGFEVKISTDDGSAGFKGRVTDLLKHILRVTSYELRVTRIFACGPKPMLCAVDRICVEYGIKGELSFEEHMACGFGACLGCVVNTKQGYKRACTEGPVFETGEIIWDK